VEFLIAFAIALVTAPVLRRVAFRLDIVDRPGPLKTHQKAVPYLGGVAVFLGLLVGLVEAGRPALLLPYGAALALGVADDARGLAPRARLGAELGIGVLAALAVPGPGLVRVATGVLVVVLLNAVNLLDGQDGLAAGAGIVSAVAFAILGGDAEPLGLALAGALAAFLVFNAPPARMYLGDGGAYLVGTVLATLPSLTEHGTTDWSVWIGVPLVVGLPLADTAIAILRRLLARRPLFEGDRSHVYDQLVDRGLSARWVTVALAGLQALLTVIGVAVMQLDTTWAYASALVVILLLALAAAMGGFVTATTQGSTT
jgi:UDP-GlcNAc:undecaprenyl-phosphate/decaprenyl-phosphate GlcNAc-1-phosphate transferase